MPTTTPSPSEQIQSTGQGAAWVLVDETTGEPVPQGAVRPDFRGDSATVTGGAAPHKPSSEGRIYVDEGGRAGSYYPSCYGCAWRRAEAGE